MADNTLIIMPDVSLSWSGPPDLPPTYWLDPNVNYLRTENGTIIVTETGEPFAP